MSYLRRWIPAAAESGKCIARSPRRNYKRLYRRTDARSTTAHRARRQLSSKGGKGGDTDNRHISSVPGVEVRRIVIVENMLTRAVLPLENLSHDPEQEYFADGMSEALITQLSVCVDCASSHDRL